MPNPGPERLRKLALDALEEVVAQADHEPVRRTWAVRFSLAYLSSLDRMRWRSGEPYRDFWRAMGIERRALRTSGLRSALATIYAWADLKRDPERVAFFCRARTAARSVMQIRHCR
jgi:hypothetical protein